MSEAVATESFLKTAPPLPVVSPRLAALWKRGADFLGCPVAILGGAMSWVSERHLVAAISNAGDLEKRSAGPWVKQ